MNVSFEKKFLLFLIIVSMVSFFNKSFAKYEKIFYDFNIKNINGNNLDLSKYKNKAVLLVNVASYCGFTNQYADLQKLWEKYKDNGLIVLGVPSNQFGRQEPGTNNEIKTSSSSEQSNVESLSMLGQKETLPSLQHPKRDRIEEESEPLHMHARSKAGAE